MNQECITESKKLQGKYKRSLASVVIEKPVKAVGYNTHVNIHVHKNVIVICSAVSASFISSSVEM